jgi:hypothetical protein
MEKTQTQDYTVMFDRETDTSHPHLAPTYSIAIGLSARFGGAMGMTQGLSSARLAHEMRQYFDFTQAAIDRFLSSDDPEVNITLLNYPLSDEVAKHFNF